MTDEQQNDHHPHPGAPAPASVCAPGARAGDGVWRGSRRPRPATVYSAARRASLARHRERVERVEAARPRTRVFIVPIVALAALLVGSLVAVDRVHPFAGAVAPAPPAVSTAAPARTPVAVSPPPTTRAGVAAEIHGAIVPMSLYAMVVRVDANGMQQGGTDPTTGASVPPVDVTTPAGLKQLHQRERDDLNQLIQTAAAVAYAKQHHLVATAQQVQDALNNLYAQYGGKDAFLQSVEAEGYTQAGVTQIVTDGTTEQNVFNQVGKQAPDDGKTVRYIVIAAKDKTLADTLAAQLQADHGSNFAALAKKYSTDTATAAQGGSLGVVTKGELETSVDTVIFSLKQGQISNPVKAQAGWEILQVLGPGQSQSAQSTYFNNWLVAQQKQATIYVKIPNP